MQNPWISLMCGTASMILGLSILVEFRQDVETLLLRFTIAMEDGNVRVWNMSERHKGYFHGSNGRDSRLETTMGMGRSGNKRRRNDPYFHREKNPRDFFAVVDSHLAVAPFHHN